MSLYLERRHFVSYVCYNKITKAQNMAKFKLEVLELIKNDPDLFIAVANELGIKPISMSQTLLRNGASLNQYSIVTLVANRLNRKPEDLLEDATVKEEQS
jgi:hypothetical protein